MKVRLICLDSSSPKGPIVLKQLPAIVGRGHDADVQIPDCCVSRRHCEIDEINGVLVVRDIGSRHGTFVNGVRVNEGHLVPGNRLTIGLSSFQVQYKRKAGFSAEHEGPPSCLC